MKKRTLIPWFIPLVGALSLVTLSPKQALSDVPVFDAANLAELVAQAVTLTEQLTVLINMYENMTGVSGHARMLKDPLKLLHDFLPPDSIDPEELLKGPFKAFIEALREIEEDYSAEELFEQGVRITGAARQYKARSDYIYSYMAIAKDAYANISGRRAILQNFSDALETATTLKSILDLNTRIAAENTLLLNEIAQLQALTLMARMQERSMVHNAQGLQAKRATKPEDLDFD